MREITPAERRALRARAHHLDPVVHIGHGGLTPQVLREIDRALLAHELIKVRVLGDERLEREALLAKICAETDAAAVQHLGKLLVLWRPRPEQPPADAGTASTRRAPGGGGKRAPRSRKPASRAGPTPRRRPR